MPTHLKKKWQKGKASDKQLKLFQEKTARPVLFVVPRLSEEVKHQRSFAPKLRLVGEQEEDTAN